jgi:UDP-N-acetyl-D-mannosaminuronate dehydrogenase
MKVVAYDPCCKESFGVEMARSLIETIKDSDCIIIVTDHAEFKRIDLQLLKNVVKAFGLGIMG